MNLETLRAQFHHLVADLHNTRESSFVQPFCQPYSALLLRHVSVSFLTESGKLSPSTYPMADAGPSTFLRTAVQDRAADQTASSSV
jgi:hypothetical protein